MKVLRFMLIVALALPVFAADEMRKLDFLAGEWKGEGWFQMGPGKPETYLQFERVTPKAGGKALLIEGLGNRKMPDGSAGEVVHEALALLGYDEAAKKYRFSTVTAQRGAALPWFEVTGTNAAQWGLDVPQGKMRYTISLSETGEWVEYGEFSRDGEKWMKFMEMKLKKVK